MDYISRADFLEGEQNIYCVDCSRRKNSKGRIVYEIGGAPCRACGIGDVLDDLEDFPAADVVERKKGKWIFDGDCYKCNKCGAVYSWWADSQVSNYCPNCGADMREE